MFIKADNRQHIELNNRNIFSVCFEHESFLYLKYEQGNLPYGNFEYQEITEKEFNEVYNLVFPKEEEPEPQPTDQDLINAQILLNQAEQDAKLQEIDETLALILLNQEGGIQNVL